MNNANKSQDIFFVHGTELVLLVDPYSILNLPESTRQAEIVERLSGESADADAFAGAILSNPLHRLAYHLIKPPEKKPGASQFGRSQWRFVDQRACAAHMLLALLVREVRQMPFDKVPDAWEEVKARWKSIAKSSAALEWLSGLAKNLAIENPRDQAGMVLGAIESELFPNLHALLAVGAASESLKSFHLAEGMKSYSPDAPNLMRYVKRNQQELILANARTKYEAGAVKEAMDEFAKLDISGGKMHAMLAAEVAEMLLSVAAAAHEREWPANAPLMEAAERGARLFPYDYRIHRALAVFYIRCTQHELAGKEDFFQAQRMLSKVYVIDPRTPHLEGTVLLLKASILKLAESLRRVASLLNSSAADGLAAKLHEQAQRPMGGVEAFIDEAGTKEFQTTCLKVLPAQLVAKIGLDPVEETNLAAGRALVEVVTEGGSLTDPEVKNRLIEAHPLLEAVAWEPLVQAQQESETPADFVLALPELPRYEAPPSDIDRVTGAYEELARRLPAQPAYQKAKFPVVYPWLFSSKDLFAKCAGGLGLVLTIVSLYDITSTRVHASMAESAYGDFSAALKSSDQGRIVDSAYRVLKHTEFDPKDQRSAQLVPIYEETLLASIMEAAGAGDEARLEDLVERAMHLAKWAKYSSEERTNEP